MFRSHGSQPSHIMSLGLVCLFVGVLSSDPALLHSADRYQDARDRLVDEFIVREGVTNSRVIQVMRDVPRHEFVPSRLRKQAYDDQALPIGYKQTISPPFIVAYMTEAIDPRPTDRVLEIGTGSGYQAAVLSGLVREVFTIEIVESLGKNAARLLKRLGYDNVQVKVGDGYQGWPEHAPFDKIIVTCSPENIPVPLVEQLAEGGKMLIPVGERYQQVFHLLEKRNGKLTSSQLIPTLFVPMTGTAEDLRQQKPDPLNPTIVNGGFETDANSDGKSDSWHYQRQTTRTEGSDAPEGDHYIVIENDTPGRLAQLLQGMPVDGRRIRALDVSVFVKVERAYAGSSATDVPGLTIHFFDSVRRPIEWRGIGPWLRVSDWEQYTATLPVPDDAREAVVRIGLNGATGRICLDDVRLRGVASR